MSTKDKGKDKKAAKAAADAEAAAGDDEIDRTIVTDKGTFVCAHRPHFTHAQALATRTKATTAHIARTQRNAKNNRRWGR